MAAERILLLGGSSFVGSSLLRRSAFSSCISTRHSASRPEGQHWIRLDVREPDAVGAIVRDVQPTVVVDCTLPRTPDFASIRDSAANVVASLRASAPRAYLVYISTDAVFDGATVSGPHRESEEAAPLSPYAVSKRQAEVTVLSAATCACVLRASILFGVDGRTVGSRPDGRLCAMLATLRKAEPRAAFVDQWRSPTWVDDLARAIELAIRYRIEGLFHVSSGERWSRYDFARQVALAFGYDPSLVARQSLRDEHLADCYGRDTSLDGTKLSTALGIAATPPRVALAQIVKLVAQG